MLKLRDAARTFHMKAVGNGKLISFWFDRWSEIGVMIEILSERGLIEMGIRREATLEEVLWNQRRKKRHRWPLSNEVEKELSIVKDKLTLDMDMDDVDMWRWKSGFKPSFSTSETWSMIREVATPCTWGQSIWFAHATMDRIAGWNPGVDTTCVLCKRTPETRNHLFFECSFSSLIWEHLVKGLLGIAYSNKWNIMVELVYVPTMEKRKRFCLRYALQVTVYTLWWERNMRRHGDPLRPMQFLAKFIDKSIRNQLSLVQMKEMKGSAGFGGLQFEQPPRCRFARTKDQQIAQPCSCESSRKDP
ncbi:uncharacterized protein LOC106417100 [Brassica napus]|uniref:uncharacterized protein LOC106344756 n=1 Tax=Brassica oleracea var. oleracea TaxID=109376 RepID=UPI0006A6BB40|nr:PREDICTED: uncharacterized protein LOC106344756 [Brassica oleracea var. oleracea]XP_013713413.1 uncharacterized protein LOC106417100 [Brassica napus]